MSKDRTCEERILEHLNSRIADFGAMTDLASVYNQARLDEVLEDANTRELFEEIKPDDFEELEGGNYDELAENARQRIYETPLGVSSKTVFRVDLSTGGPGDWLEVETSGNTPRYESIQGKQNAEHFEVDRITYHFNDWFDHAERALEGSDFDTALAFVREVVPELMD
jgi:hypothetical protein